MKKILLIMLALVATIAAQAWTVKFTNPSNWDQPAVWCWEGSTNFTGGTWPGATMTKDGDVWVYTGTGNPGSNAEIIFNNNNKGSQTNNLKFVDGATYDLNGVVGAKMEEYNAYFKDEAGWGDPVYAYTFEPEIFGGWPGKQLSKNADGLYVVTIEATSNPSMKGIIFSNGKNEGQGQLKTGDLTWETGKTYTNGSAVTPGEDAIYLAGPFNSWSSNDSNYLFSKVSDTEYTLSLASVDADFCFKVIINGTWLGNVNEALASGKAYDLYDTFEENCALSGAAKDVKFSVNPVANTLTVTYTANGEVVVPPTPGTDKDLYLVGENFGNWSLDDTYKMQRSGNVYTIELSNGLNGKWKIWDGTWDYSFGANNEAGTIELAKNNEVWFDATDFNTTISGGVKVTLTLTEGSDVKDSSIPAILLVESTTAVDAIEAADADALYFNLQGVKVANPANGIYVKVLNGKATKVVIK